MNAQTKLPAPSSADISAHLHALFPPAFVHGYPDALVEIAYGPPGNLNRAELFSAFRLDAATDFAVAQNLEGCNVYVGPTLKKGVTAPFGRTSKEDFLAGGWLWTEYDGPGEIDAASAKAAELGLAPGIIVDTGSTPHARAHVYYKLAGGIADLGEFEGVNRALQNHLGGDPVHDASRVMRLAGTVSYPPAKKLERGYVVEAVKIRLHQKPREHDASAFVKLNPAGSGASHGSRKSGLGFDIPRDDGELVALLESSRVEGKWHNSIRDAIATMIGRGWSDIQIRLACAAYCKGELKDFDLNPLIEGARTKWGKPNPEGGAVKGAEAGPLIKSSKDFVAGFVPPEYVLVGVVQRRFLYALTGQTGSGKTAVTLRLAASVAMGADFAGCKTKKCRVLYCAAENPDDVRMRWIALAPHMDFDVNEIDVYFTEGTFSISQMTDKLRQEVERIGGDFGLVIVDTGPAFFEGDDENNRSQMGAHARKFRTLIEEIPGGPSVIVNGHPVKNATADNLLPAGGGTYLNEIDGNLTCAKKDSLTEMHWQGKFRGPEFSPMSFLIKTVTHPALKDSDERLIPSVICEYVSDTAAEEMHAAGRRDEDLVLGILSEKPSASLSDVAIAMGWTLYSGKPHKTKAKRCVEELKKAKLIKLTRAGNWEITAEGKKAAKGDE
jgi:hypothetical protein